MAPHTARGSTREQKKANTRIELIRAAVELFQAQGVEATTVDQIAAKANSSSRTFFRYFGSKDEVVFGDNEATLREFGKALERSRKTDPLEALRDAFTNTLANYGRLGDAELEAACIELWFDPAMLSRWGTMALKLEKVSAEFLAREWKTHEDDSIVRANAVAIVTVVRLALILGGKEGVEGRLAVANRGFELLHSQIGILKLT